MRGSSLKGYVIRRGCSLWMMVRFMKASMLHKGAMRSIALSRVGHYGYPYRSYSVPYGGQAWPNNRKYPASEYREPLFSFGVSPGVSDMTHVRLPEIDGWEDVVLLGSLVGQSLFRLVIKEERVVLFESLEVGYRLRALEFVGEHIYVKVDQYYSPSAIYRFDVRYKH